MKVLWSLWWCSGWKCEGLLELASYWVQWRFLHGAIMSLNKSVRFCTGHSSPQSCLCQRLMFTTFTKPNPELTCNHVIISLAFQHLECYLPLNQGFRPVWHHQCFGKTNLHMHSYAGSKYPERPTSNFHIWNRPLYPGTCGGRLWLWPSCRRGVKQRAPQ